MQLLGPAGDPLENLPLRQRSVYVDVAGAESFGEGTALAP